MKKITLVLSILASACVLASCANKGTEQPTVSNDTVTTAPVKHHHDLKGETVAK